VVRFNASFRVQGSDAAAAAEAETAAEGADRGALSFLGAVAGSLNGLHKVCVCG